MNDRELLELAAKAAGLEWKWDQPRGSKVGYLRIREGDRWPMWKPLTDDGEALRLAVKLGIQVTPFLSGACAVTTPEGWNRTESGYEDGYAATRRAIVRAAAELGRSLP